MKPKVQRPNPFIGAVNLYANVDMPGGALSTDITALTKAAIVRLANGISASFTSQRAPRVPVLD